MQKEKVFLFLLLAVLISACSSSPETPFNENGISFTCPAGWEIDETELDEDGFYVCVEKQGMNDSGLLMVMAFAEETDVEEYIEAYKEQLESQGVLENLIFAPLTPMSYGSYSGTGTKYTTSVLGVPHHGEIIVFDTNGKTVAVTMQEALEDQKKNKDGFKKIEETFKVD